jgi:hypothetical protein
LGALTFGAIGGFYDAAGHYANGCGHGSIVAVGAAAGIAGALVVVASFVMIRRTPPMWLAVSVVLLILPIVGSTSSISSDDLSGGGCRYSKDAAVEDAVGAGWLTLAGGIALAAAAARKRR